MAPLLVAVGFSAATAGTIATVATVAGTGLAVAGQFQQGRVAAAEAESAQNIAEFNVQVQKREAVARRRRATFAQKRQVKRGAEIKSTLTARLGAAGAIGSPVAADLAAEQAAELELENLLIGFEGEVGAQQALTQAQLDKLQAGVFKARKRPARQAAAIGAGTTLLTGFA